MTQFTNEPLWVGMDVDAELERYAELDRLRQTTEPSVPPAPKASRLKRGLRAAIPSRGRGGAPGSPLVA